MLSEAWFMASTWVYFHYERTINSLMTAVDKAVDKLRELFKRG